MTHKIKKDKNMSTNQTFPHPIINVIDYSNYEPEYVETLPLLRPIFFMRAQRGKIGVPVYCYGYNDAVAKFGAGTFDRATKYFSREALYLDKLFTRQGGFVVRLAPEDASYASAVLSCSVKKVDVVQYKMDANGQYILAPDGSRIPYKENGADKTEPGVELKWTLRALEDGETISNLKPQTIGEGDEQYTVYPVLAVRANSSGSFGNDTGFKFYTDIDNVDTILANQVGSLPYVFGPVQKTYGQDTVSPIKSVAFNNNYETFVCKPNVVDDRVARQVSFDDVINNYYGDVLPWEMHMYSENIEELGKMVMEVEPNDDTLTDPFLVNLVGTENIDGEQMTHVVFSEDDDAIMLNSQRILYLQDGSDGDISDASIEELTRQYLLDDIYPEIFDVPRYPFTHIFDTGVSLDTKEAFIQFLGKHDSFKLVLSTQDANMGRYNTKAEDLSMGSALHSACLLQPECAIKGTEVCRAEIYQEAGKLVDDLYQGIVPFTLDAMLKKSQVLSVPYINGSIGGLPASEITIFKEYNWVACDPSHKQLSWNNGLNYAQHFSMNQIHWPDMRTVYRYDTSVLTDGLYTDTIVFIKHAVRRCWARFAGTTMTFEQLAGLAQQNIMDTLRSIIGTKYTYSVRVEQSAEEAKIGYISHVYITLYGNPTQRIWEVDIECKRTGFND